MSSDHRDSGLPRSMDGVRRWLIEARIVPDSAFAQTPPLLELPELADVIADIEALSDPAAGRRLREIETDIAAMEPGAVRDAALRDRILDLPSQIECLDPGDERVLLDLWGQLGNARDQAAALKPILNRQDLVTDGIRAAVVQWAQKLSRPAPFTDGWFGLANALDDSIPFLDSCTTGQLEALQASTETFSDIYPQAGRAKAAIQLALKSRRDREPQVDQPIRSSVSEGHAAAQAPAASPSVSQPLSAYSAETLYSPTEPPPPYTVE